MTSGWSVRTGWGEYNWLKTAVFSSYDDDDDDNNNNNNNDETCWKMLIHFLKSEIM